MYIGERGAQKANEDFHGVTARRPIDESAAYIAELHSCRGLALTQAPSPGLGCTLEFTSATCTTSSTVSQLMAEVADALVQSEPFRGSLVLISYKPSPVASTVCTNMSSELPVSLMLSCSSLPRPDFPKLKLLNVLYLFHCAHKIARIVRYSLLCIS